MNTSTTPNSTQPTNNPTVSRMLSSARYILITPTSIKTNPFAILISFIHVYYHLLELILPCPCSVRMKYCLDYNTHFVKIILQKYYKHKCYIVTIILDKPKKIFQLSLQQYFLFLPRTTSAENRYLHYLLPSQCRNYRLDPPLLTSKLTDTVQTVPITLFKGIQEIPSGIPILFYY